MKNMLFVILFLLVSVHLVEADERLGIGVILGEPTGLSAKKWISDDRAIDAGVAWSFSENASLQFHSDYLIHKYGVLTNDGFKVNTPVYFGIGGRLKLKESDHGSGRNDDDSLVGIRFPLGINYIYEKSPFDLFAEIVPILDILPDSDFDFNFAVGARYYFD